MTDNISNFNYVTDINTINRSRSTFNFRVLLRLLSIIAILILFIRLFWRLRGSSNTLNFTGFLKFLSNLNSVDIGAVNINSFVVGGDWGVFNFLRNFFNIFANLFGVVVWLSANVINVIRYLVAFIQFLFV